MTQGGGDGLGDEDGVGDEREADDEAPGLLESVESGDESGEEEDGENDRTVVTNLNLGGERYDGGDDLDEGGPVEDPGGDEEEPAVLPHLPVLLDDGDLVNVDPGGQRGGGSAEAAFDELPLPSQGTQSYPKPRFLRSHLCPPWRRLTINTFQLTSGPPKV